MVEFRRHLTGNIQQLARGAAGSSSEVRPTGHEVTIGVCKASSQCVASSRPWKSPALKLFVQRPFNREPHDAAHQNQLPGS